MMDLVSVVRQCHNDDPWSDSTLTPLLAGKGGTQIGFLPRPVVAAIQDSGRGAFEWNDDASAFWIHSNLRDHEEKTEAINKVAQDWRDRNLFPDPLKGWRNELYAIFGPGNHSIFHLERSACAVFGLATFGVHATAYVPTTYQIWVPKRASTKSTWPGYLDNSVAGGITAGDLPFESMVRECGEEAGLDRTVVEKAMKQTGVISYFYRTTGASRWCQPEVEYTYDIPLDPSVQLHPVDGEAESFELMSVEEVLELMRQGRFKPNCSMVLLDFLIRHGKLTAENCDCDYLELVCLLHNDLRLPSMKTMQ